MRFAVSSGLRLLVATGAVAGAGFVTAMPAAHAGPRCNVTHWHQHYHTSDRHYHDWWYETSYNNHGITMRSYWVTQHNSRHTISCGSNGLMWNGIDAATDPYYDNLLLPPMS